MPDKQGNLDSCLKCSYCNTVCPVLKVLPDYPGPKKLGSDIERFRREGISFAEAWVDYCLGCKQCSLICPNQVNVSEYISEAKTQQTKRSIRKFRDYLLARPALLGQISSFSAPLSNSLLTIADFLMPIGGITSKRKFPEYSRTPLTRTLSSGNRKSSQERILFFPGCFIKYNNPRLGETAIGVLEKAGYAVEIAGTDCCGLPAYDDKQESRTAAKNNILAMADAVINGSKIVTLCTSCGNTLKSDYAKLFFGNERLRTLADLIAANTYDFGELMLELLAEKRLQLSTDKRNRRLAYHAPCHLKGQGIGNPWFNILKNIPGLEVYDLDAGCCGMSGTYGFRTEKYSISMRIGENLFYAIKDFSPQQVISECAGCRMQIEHGTHLQTLHPVEVFAQMLGAQDKTDTA